MIQEKTKHLSDYDMSLENRILHESVSLKKPFEQTLDNQERFLVAMVSNLGSACILLVLHFLSLCLPSR